MPCIDQYDGTALDVAPIVHGQRNSLRTEMMAPAPHPDCARPDDQNRPQDVVALFLQDYRCHEHRGRPHLQTIAPTSDDQGRHGQLSTDDCIRVLPCCQASCLERRDLPWLKH